MTYEFWLRKKLDESRTQKISFLETKVLYYCENCSWFTLCNKLGTPECPRYIPEDSGYVGIEIFRGLR